ncbi:MAG TPA: ATP-binding protein [Gemmatimonadaceae bacterium]|jgi:signal transduction histidine kinase
MTPSRSTVAQSGRTIRLAALRVPLAAKIVGANLLVVILLLAGWLYSGNALSSLMIALAAPVILVHLGLVFVALQPVRDLETVAARVWQGDFSARVEWSSVADDEVLRVGSMFNTLLDGMESDRARMRALATDVVASGDRDRAALARELHDSTAQNVASLLLQLSTVARDTSDPRIRERLQSARDAAQEILDELRMLSHTVHPSVLDDLGLEAALRRLARDASNGNGIAIDVSVTRDDRHDRHDARRLPMSVESVLYRVANEAVCNATHHAAPERIRVQLHVQGGYATIDVHDDGVGFDPSDLGARRNGTGLRSMRERVALANGKFEIKTAAGSGTTVSATVPIESAAAAHPESA